MNVIIQSEEELIRTLRDAIHILNNMRHYQKLWEAEYGVYAKTKKKEWELKADSFLNEKGNPQIKIKS